MIHVQREEGSLPWELLDAPYVGLGLPICKAPGGAASTSARAERLKHAARTTPDVPATTELTPDELEALVLLKRDQRKRTGVIPDGPMTLGQAVRWIADIGGYFPSNGPPGATVIARGLERLEPASRLIRALHDAGRLR